MICKKCEGNLITPEWEFIKSCGWESRYYVVVEGECWRCTNGYWEGIESIFNQFEMNKHDVFFMIVEYLERKAEDEETTKEEMKMIIAQLKKIYHIPF